MLARECGLSSDTAASNQPLCEAAFAGLIATTRTPQDTHALAAALLQLESDYVLLSCACRTPRGDLPTRLSFSTLHVCCVCSSSRRALEGLASDSREPGLNSTLSAAALANVLVQQWIRYLRSNLIVSAERVRCEHGVALNV